MLLVSLSDSDLGVVHNAVWMPSDEGIYYVYAGYFMWIMHGHYPLHTIPLLVYLCVLWHLDCSHNKYIFVGTLRFEKFNICDHPFHLPHCWQQGPRCESTGYLVEEGSTCQNHWELAGVVGVVQPGLVVHIPSMVTPREAHDSIPGLTPHTEQENRVN